MRTECCHVPFSALVARWRLFGRFGRLRPTRPSPVAKPGILNRSSQSGPHATHLISTQSRHSHWFPSHGLIDKYNRSPAVYSGYTTSCLVSVPRRIWCQSSSYGERSARSKISGEGKLSRRAASKLDHDFDQILSLSNRSGLWEAFCLVRVYESVQLLGTPHLSTHPRLSAHLEATLHRITLEHIAMAAPLVRMESLQRVYSPHDRSPALERAEGTGETSKESTAASAPRGRSKEGRRRPGAVAPLKEKVDSAVARSPTGIWRRTKREPWGFKVGLERGM